MVTADGRLSVLQANHADISGGGAALAGYRLHRALRAAGVRSAMVVGSRTSTDPDVTELRTPGQLRRPIRAVATRAGLNELDGVAAFRLTQRPEFRAADVVHYHAVHGSWFSYPALVRATRAKPSVLTLHDQWPLTGHCSFAFECERWRHGCGHCPHPEVFPAIRRDATAVEWRLKREVWARSRLTVVSPSRWLAAQATESLLGHLEITVIPHGIDTDVFAPIDREVARGALGLAGGPVLMYGATSLNDHRKGGDLFLEAVGLLPVGLRRDLTVLLMGTGGPEAARALDGLGARSRDLGYLVDDRLKALAYSAADAFAFPTRADNSPLVVLESLACGTPVVSFDVGGLSELVSNGDNGMLAPAEDTAVMASHLVVALEQPETARELGGRARARVVAEHPSHLAVERHCRLYRRLAGTPG